MAQRSAALDPPGDDLALDRLAGLRVTPMIAGPGTCKWQPVGADMILAEHVARHIDWRLPFTGEVVKAKLPSFSLIA